MTVATPRPPGWQAEKSQRMRDAVLTATADCLLEVGFAQTTTERIVRAAGVSRGAMTHHFPSRNALLAAAAAQLAGQQVGQFDAVLGDDSAWSEDLLTRERLESQLGQLLECFRSPVALAFDELQQGARGEAELQGQVAPHSRFVAQHMRRRLARRFPAWDEAGQRQQGEALADMMLLTLQGMAREPDIGIAETPLVATLARVVVAEYALAQSRRDRHSGYF